MTPQELELHVREAVEAMCARRPVEDEWIELKREWVEPPAKAARQIAALANSAGSPHVLWIVGADEKAGAVVELKELEFSAWWRSVESSFNEVAPKVIRQRRITTPHGDVFALLFDAELVPYVVINPAYGHEKGESVQFEVPWRGGSTTTRSARRSELLEVLVPRVHLPDFELLEGSLSLSKEPQSDGLLRGGLSIESYVTSDVGVSVVVPFHRCSGEIALGDTTYQLTRISIVPTPQRPIGLRLVRMESSVSIELISGSQDQVLIQGPGMVTIRAEWSMPEAPSPVDIPAACTVRAAPVHAQAALALQLELQPRKPGELPGATHAFHWQYRKKR